MPTLGFLKKKKTKDSHDSPTSPTQDKHNVGSPISPQISKASTIFTDPESTFAGGKEDSGTGSALTATNTNTTKPSAVAPTSAGAGGQVQGVNAMANTQNVPSIGNMINGPNYGNTASNNPNDSGYSSQTSSTQQSSVPTLSLPQKGGAGTSNPVRETKGKYTLTDFSISRTLGTGSFGRVHLVQSKHNQRFYAVKVLKKAQVVKMKQVEHTNDERRMLQRCRHPFLVSQRDT